MLNLMKSKFLRNLYTLLIKLSPDDWSHRNVFGDDAVSMAVTNRWFRTRIKFAEITCLSNLLFEKLKQEFELLISSGSGFIPPSTTFEAKGISKLDKGSSNEEFFLLLRCCMIMLNFLEFDQSLILEKCQILNAILRKLGHLLDLFSCHHGHFVLEIAQKVSDSESIALHQCTFAQGAMRLTAGALSSFSCRVLEVFIHELLLHQQLRKHVVITDCVTENPDKLFASHCNLGDLSAILEVVSFHFLISVCDERASLKFIRSLSWSTGFLETAELSVSATLALLGIPVIFTAPYMLQAHVILLASKCIGILVPNDDRKPDDGIFECYMSAFELSVNLYGRYISALESTKSANRDELTSYLREPYFGSYVQPSTQDKINLQSQNLVDFCGTHFSGFLSRSKVQFRNDSVSYIRENQQVIDLSCREEGSLILNCVVSHILSKEAEMNTMPHKDGRTMQVECCLAAVLKLMSSSLLKILWFLKQNSFLGGKRTPMGNHCSEYKFIKSVVQSFERYDAHKYVKNILFNECDAQTGRYREIQLMFEHFSSLALYSFNRRLTFLWNGSIFMMMTISNLFQFEKDEFVTFRQLLGDTHETSKTQFSSKILPDKALESSSLHVASNLQNLRKLYLRDNVNSSPCSDGCVDIGHSSKSDKRDDGANSTSIPVAGEDAHGADSTSTPVVGEDAYGTDEADVCNGRLFVNCLSEYQNDPAEWEDLVDFIECKPGKDYSYWLRSRKVFRKWQNERIAVVKRARRKVKTRRKIF